MYNDFELIHRTLWRIRIFNTVQYTGRLRGNVRKITGGLNVLIITSRYNSTPSRHPEIVTNGDSIVIEGAKYGHIFFSIAIQQILYF